MTAAIASGNTEAFARFYRDWFDRAFADARRATGRDESFCLDVVQDAMMRVVRAMRVMESEGELRNWLRVVVTRCAYDRLRKEKRTRMREAGVAGEDEATGQVLDERLAWLQAELNTLDAGTRSLFVLRFRLGWTLDRIGRLLGLKAGAVDGRIRRATQELKQKATQSHDE